MKCAARCVIEVRLVGNYLVYQDWRMWKWTVCAGDDAPKVVDIVYEI